MDCNACAISIDGDLEDMEGIQSARTHYAKSVTEVAFDPKKINEAEIVKVIKKTGYTVKSL